MGSTLTWPEAAAMPDGVRLALFGPGAPFELTLEDVLGVEMEVFAKRPHSLRDVLLSGAQRFGDRPYVTFPDRELTFSSVVTSACAVAATLRDRYGVTKGDRVGIAAANCVEYAITFWAATMLGAITVAMNGWWTGTELSYGIALTTPKVLLGDRRRLERLAGQEAGVETLVFEDEFAELEAAGAGAGLPDVTFDEDDPFLILFTSGTTGRPKGAVLQHRASIHFMMSHIAQGAGRAAAAGAAPTTNPPTTVSCAPMFHVSGLTAQVIMAPFTGQHIVYPPPGRFDEDVFLGLAAQYRMTNMSLVPAQLWRLLEWPDLNRYDLSALSGIGGGGSVWPPELLRLLEEKLPSVRPSLGVGYGMTETVGLGTTLRGQLSYEHPESVGFPSPGVLVEVRDPETAESVDDGEVAEVCMRSPANFLGYWDNPDATAAVLDSQRWYRTGDYGHIAGGLLFLEGRRRDLILRGAENIYPIEIENRLVEHPDVIDAAVIGVDHPILGQEVKAVVATKMPPSLTVDDVRTWVAETLAAYKVPAHVEFVGELPYNASGKVMKHLLEQPGQSSGFERE